MSIYELLAWVCYTVSTIPAWEWDAIRQYLLLATNRKRRPGRMV